MECSGIPDENILVEAPDIDAYRELTLDQMGTVADLYLALEAYDALRE